MGITVLQNVILGGKSSVLWSEFAIYGSAGASRKTQFSDHKTDNLPVQMPILRTVIP